MFDLGGGLSILTRSSWWRSRLLYAAGIGVCWVPQIFQWKMIYGKYISHPAGWRHFLIPAATHVAGAFLHPEWILHLWTPLTLLGIGGLVLGAF